MKMKKDNGTTQKTTFAYVFTSEGVTITDYISDLVINELRKTFKNEDDIIVINDSVNNDVETFVKATEMHINDGNHVAMFSVRKRGEEYVMSAVSNGTEKLTDLALQVMHEHLSEPAPHLSTDEMMEEMADALLEMV